jgi:hypothetical protein
MHITYGPSGIYYTTYFGFGGLGILFAIPLAIQALQFLLFILAAFAVASIPVLGVCLIIRHYRIKAKRLSDYNDYLNSEDSTTVEKYPYMNSNL